LPSHVPSEATPENGCVPRRTFRWLVSRLMFRTWNLSILREPVEKGQRSVRGTGKSSLHSRVQLQTDRDGTCQIPSRLWD